MSFAFDEGLRGPICNGCSLARSRWELGDKFLFLPAHGVYELDAKPINGQGEPLEYQGRPIKFRWFGMSYGHSDECYHWKPPKLPTTWVTKDKRELKIKEMETSHIENTINFLNRGDWIHKHKYIRALQRELDKRK